MPDGCTRPLKGGLTGRHNLRAGTFCGPARFTGRPDLLAGPICWQALLAAGSSLHAGSTCGWCHAGLRSSVRVCTLEALLIQRETHLDRDLPVLHTPFLDMAARLDHFEPANV